MEKLLKVLAITLMLILLSGCTTSQSSDYKLPPQREEGTSVELVLWETYNEKEHKIFMEIVQMFEEENTDIKVSVQRVPWGGHWNRIVTSLATGETPDIARIDIAHLPTLADRRAIVDFGLLGVDDITNQFEDPVIKSNIYKKKLWALPDKANPSVLFYNKDIFSKAGVDFPNSNWTWQNLISAGLQLSEVEGTYGFAIENSFRDAIPYFGTYGATLLNEKGTQMALDSKQAIDAISLKVSLANEHNIAAKTWADGALDLEEGFTKQKYAMVIADGSKVDKFLGSNINFGVSPVPKGPNGTSSYISGTSMVVFRNSEHPREAYEFIKFLTSTYIQQYWVKELGYLPVNKQAYGTLDTDAYPHLKVFTEQIKHSIPNPVIVNYSKLEEIFSEEIKLAFEGRKTSEQALKDAIQQVNDDPSIFGKNK